MGFAVGDLFAALPDREDLGALGGQREPHRPQYFRLRLGLEDSPMLMLKEIRVRTSLKAVQQFDRLEQILRRQRQVCGLRHASPVMFSG